MEVHQLLIFLLLSWTIDADAQIFSDFFQSFGQPQSFTLAPITYNTRKPIKTTRKHVTQEGNKNHQSQRTDDNTTPKTHRKTVKNNNKRVVTQNSNNHNKNVDNHTTKPKANRNDAIVFTTQSPFYHPGVKPANVDQNRPPITNKPYKPIHLTERPNKTNRPIFNTDFYPNNPNIDTNKQGNTERPNYNTNQPTFDRPYEEYDVNRPTFDRPNESGRPIEKPTEDGIAFVEDDGPPLIAGVDEDSMSSAEKKRYMDIAEQMCNKYKSMTTSHIQAIPLLPSPEPVNVNVSQCTPVNIPLIVGGKVVSIKEFPHMALVGWNSIQGGYSWKCGGSLLSDRFVLTAAHCAYQERDDTVVLGTPRVVSLGSSYLNDPRAVIVKVSKAIRHPQYKLPKSYYDIALLKLAKTVKFTDTIRPACLGSPPKPGNRIIATGWGKTSNAGAQSINLRSVSLPAWSAAACSRALGTSRRLPAGVHAASQLCAGDAAGARDTCQGDSGGPAQIQDGCLWRVTAVTSLGRSCGAPDTPGLYAIVQIPFIAAHVFEGVQLESKPNKPTYDSQQIYYDYNNRNSNDNNQNSYDNQSNRNNNNQNIYDNQNNINKNNQNSNDYQGSRNNENQNTYDNQRNRNNNNQNNVSSNNNQNYFNNYDNEKTVNYDVGSSSQNYDQNSYYNDRNNADDGNSNVRPDYGRNDNDFGNNPYKQEERDRNIYWT